MIRFYLLATLIVVLVGSVLVAHRLAAPNLRIAAQPTGTPTIEQAVPDTGAAPQTFDGEGSWVLSALPACFDERFRARGPLGTLRADLPPEAERIAAPARLRAGPCTLHLRPHDLWVERGVDRLRVPPDAALYRTDDGLTLVVRHGGDVEIRRYAIRSAAPRSG